MKAVKQAKVLKTLKKESFLAPRLSRSTESIYDQLLNHDTHIALIGLGPEGRALGLEFSQDMEVIGFDENPNLVAETRSTMKSILSILPKESIIPHISFSEQTSALKDAKVFIVNLDNEVDESNAPVLTSLKQITRTIGAMLKMGDYVIFTSSVYPGCTQELLIPILEESSMLKVNQEFRVGYVPLRCTHNALGMKVVSPMIISGSDENATQEIAKIFGHFTFDLVYIAPSLKVAEAARLMIHSQRDVNIALMNEFSVLFNAAGIDSREVLRAASSQDDFISFEPGLVGGISTGLDAYYVMHQARKLGVDVELIRSSRMVNDWMPFEIVKRCEQALNSIGKEIADAKILVKGISYKENVRDVRNSKAVELCKILELKHAEVVIEDPVADGEALRKLYGLNLSRSNEKNYDLVILAVKHSDYTAESSATLRPLFKDRPVICDIRNILKNMDADVIKVAL